MVTRPLLIETVDVTILTDPVFLDPFGDGVRVSCPKRVVTPDELPPIDFLFVSHNHNDHFDIPTLATLPRRVDTVLCANHPELVQTLTALGFERVIPIRDYQTVTAGKTQLLFTPSAVPVPEHGLIVTDPDGKIWDQVDTIFELTHLPILKLDGVGLDVQLANFNPLLTVEYMTNGALSFPYEVYEELMDVVKVARAKFVVPFASGQVFTGDSAWVNPFFFPVSHRQFVDDVHALDNGSRADVVNPGDMIEIINHEPRLVREARTNLVRTIDPSYDACVFNPTAPVPPLVDSNPYQVSAKELEEALQAVFGNIDRSLRENGSIVQGLLHWAAKMAICVQFPDGPRHWHIDFSGLPPRVVRGEIKGNYVVAVTASGVHGMQTGLMWDSVLRGGFRCHHTIYRMRPEMITHPRPATSGRMRSLDVPTPFDAFCVLADFRVDAWIKRQLEKALETRRLLE